MLCLLAILLLAAGLRLLGLGRHGLWVDEGYTARLTETPVASYYRQMLHDTGPPLYYYLTRPLTLLAPRSEFALRLLPAAMGIVSVLLIYLLATELFSNRWSGLLAAVLLACCRFHVTHSQEARNYTLYFAFALGAMYCLARLARPVARRRAALWAGFVLCGAGMIYTHNIGQFFLAGLMLSYPLACRLNDRGERPGRGLRPVVDIAIAGLFIAILYLPWLPVLLYQAGHVLHGYWINPVTWRRFIGYMQWMIYRPLDTPRGHGSVMLADQSGVLFARLVWMTAAAGWIGWGAMRRDRRGPALAMGLAVGLGGLIAVSLLGESLFMAKVVMPFLAVPLLGPAALVTVGPRYVRLRQAAVTAAAVVAAAGVLSAVANHGLQYGEQWREATRWAIARAAPGRDPIVVDNDFSVMTVDWYVGGTPYGPVPYGAELPTVLLHEGSRRDASPPAAASGADEPAVVRGLRRLRTPGQRFWLIQRGYGPVGPPAFEGFLQTDCRLIEVRDFLHVRVRGFEVAGGAAP